MLALLFVAAPVYAAGLPLDVELVRPALAPGGTPGQDAPWTQPPGMPRVAALVQAEQNPVVVYSDGDYAGAVVSSRSLLQLGLRWAPLRRMDLSLAVPVAWQEGGLLPGSAEGFSPGDVEIAARYRLLGDPADSGDASALAVRADVALPTGATDAWMGEGTVRPGGALLGAVVVGRFALLAEAGYRHGTTSASDLELVTGPALVTNAAVRWSYGRVGIGFGYLGRVRLAPDATARDHASALLGSLSLRAPRGLTVDLGGGPGLGGGVGAASLRAFLGIAWTPDPLVPPVRPVSAAALVLAPPPEVVPDLVVRKPPAPPMPGWAEGELAKVEGDRIVIRDPIQFVFAKDERRAAPAAMPRPRTGSG